MQIQRNAIEPELLDQVRTDVLASMQAIDSNKDYAQSVWKSQRGICLGDCFYSAAILYLTGRLQQITHMPCDLRRCSARLQHHDGEYQLRWHQDFAPMQLNAGEDGVVAWVPLEPIDGTRPSLEVAPKTVGGIHQSDAHGFLIMSGDFDGTPLTDMAVGDIALFSPYEPHRTYITPEMTHSRLSLDMRFSPKWGIPC